MRSSLLAISLLLATSAQAAPRILTAYPRLLGRTARNMVTWHDKFAAAEEWAQIGMALYDGWVTNRVINHHQPQFDPTEINPLFGARPSASRIFGEGAMLAFQESAFTQLTHEEIDGRSSQAWDIVPLGLSSLHVVHGMMNQHICDEICK